MRVGAGGRGQGNTTEVWVLTWGHRSSRGNRRAWNTRGHGACGRSRDAKYGIAGEPGDKQTKNTTLLCMDKSDIEQAVELCDNDNKIKNKPFP